MDREHGKRRLGWALAIVALFVTIAASGQTSVEEARAKLREREQQRKAERDQVVQISAGELADLRARVQQLEAEVRSLRGSVPAKLFPDKLVPDKEQPKKPLPQAIEIGMTKDEVMAFIGARSKSLRIAGISANAGVRKSAVQTVVTRDKGAPTDPKSEGADRDRTNVETLRTTGNTETIRVERIGRYVEQTGTQRNSFGQSAPVYGPVDRVDGEINVTLVDGVVTAVNAR